MKRDMDLIREILLRFEASEKERNGTKALEGLGDGETVMGHIRLLQDSGCIEGGSVRPFPNGASYSIGWRVTSDGHDFIDSVRDPEIWRKTKAGAGSLGSWTVKLLSDLARGYIRTKATELGLPI